MWSSAGAAESISNTSPNMGKDDNKEKTSDYENQTIGFCCDDCKGKFDKEPKKYIDKVKEFKKKKSSSVEEISFDAPIRSDERHVGIAGKSGNKTKASEYEDTT